jgi:UDP-N-acetylmuramoyl-L-alanyl-D-glutamate--2,6-diaminopimelate ligase
MKLRELINKKEFPDLEIKGIAYDSRRVKEGYLFIARKGAIKYLEEAIKRGTIFVVTEVPISGISIPYLLVQDAREELAKISEKFYNYPSKELKIIGITGTFGKTTTTWLLKSIYKEKGEKVGLIGTVKYEIGEETINLPLHTTPESLDLNLMLRKMKNKGIGVVVMEVSSHALALKRVKGIDFDIAGFTVMDRDHLDFHKTMEEYKSAKLKLFTSLSKEKVAVLNRDDKVYEEFKSKIKAKIITYGKNEEAQVVGKIVEVGEEGMRIKVKWNSRWEEFYSPLFWGYNFYNVLLAISCAIVDGVEMEDIKEGIRNMKQVPGRYEKIGRVIIDYAHTPGALSSLLMGVKKIAKGRIICIFGCGGDRDRGKREEFGKIASKWSDYIIITTDNPRSEDPYEITKEIAKGIKGVDYEVILDRKEAIYYALKRTERNDIILLIGKGHERYQVYHNHIEEWNERKVVEDAMKELGLGDEIKN